MSRASAIAKNYAKALFLSSKKNNNLDKVGVELKNFQQNFSKDFIKDLENPAISRNELRKIFTEISKKFAFGETTANFFITIAENRRLKLLPDIYKEFDNIVRLQNDVLEVEIILAKEIAESEMGSLKQEISKAYSNKNIVVKKTIKEKILGGFQVKIGSKLIDASLQNQIVAIGEKCLKAVN